MAQEPISSQLSILSKIIINKGEKVETGSVTGIAAEILKST